MSHHNEDQAASTPQERQFNEFIRNGDDLLKIEQYMRAREFYQQALELHINDSLVNEKIAATKTKKKYETKVVVGILAVAVIIVGTVLLFKYQF
jgi:hypothetical protein